MANLISKFVKNKAQLINSSWEQVPTGRRGSSPSLHSVKIPWAWDLAWGIKRNKSDLFLGLVLKGLFGSHIRLHRLHLLP